ncbi:hypothetical protein NX059_004835 [Plenodomus lindquistii]|nr:hypothetical protein NX059_004835 [Plenodomus lindquistii]
MVQKQLFINNEYVDATSSEFISIYSPHDESLVADKIHVASVADVDRAVAAARAAFEGEWSTWTAAQRSAVMHKFADLVEENVEMLGDLESKSMGAPKMMTSWVFGFISQIFRYFAGWTDKVAGQSWPEEDGVYRIVQYDPIGVCAGVGAWNGTGLFFGMKVGCAVAAGCTMVYKGSEKSPIALLQLGDLIKKAGFPPGVINIVTGAGQVGAALASHMDVNKISFTGSVAAGKKVQEAAAKSNLKRVTLELGGKSPSIVFADANMENALLHSSQSFLANTGQACVAASRLFVQEDIAEDFVKRLKAKFEELANGIGAPSDAKTFMGPVVDDKQFESVMRFIEVGKGEAELVTGGARKGESGFYITPTIFLNPKDDARIYREEIFGPVVAIRTFKTEEEVIKLANDTTFGLASYVYTASMSRALRLAKKLNAGNVNVNINQTLHPKVPFGGTKQSGLGREGGTEGIMNYLEAKTIHINMNV